MGLTRHSSRASRSSARLFARAFGPRARNLSRGVPFLSRPCAPTTLRPSPGMEGDKSVSACWKTRGGERDRLPMPEETSRLACIGVRASYVAAAASVVSFLLSAFVLPEEEYTAAHTPDAVVLLVLAGSTAAHISAAQKILGEGAVVLEMLTTLRCIVEVGAASTCLSAVCATPLRPPLRPPRPRVFMRGRRRGGARTQRPHVSLLAATNTVRAFPCTRATQSLACGMSILRTLPPRRCAHVAHACRGVTPALACLAATPAALSICVNVATRCSDK
jgi:hypothetical protein